MTEVHCLREDCIYNVRGICNATIILISEKMECLTAKEES